MNSAIGASHAWTLTFYAYKGGTGRTLALTNVARFMAEELGYRIGLVDLDLESPGLVYEPLCHQLEAGHKGRQTLVEEISCHPGFVDLFNDRMDAWDALRQVSANPRKPQEPGTHGVPLSALEAQSMPEISDEDLDRHVIRLDNEGDGTIVLMPTAQAVSNVRIDNAGNGREGARELYSDSLALFLGHTSSRPPQEVAALTQAMLEKFTTRYNLDFLFLDGRTGTGSFFPVYTYAVPQLLVLFCGLNEQNIKGSLSVLKATNEKALAEAPVLLVASPVPTVGPKMLETRLASIVRELRDLGRHRESKRSQKSRTSYIYELPRGVDFMLPYNDLASYEETYFLRRFPHSQLAGVYRRLAAAIESLVRKPGTPPDESSPVLPQSIRCRGMAPGNAPLLIAAENVTEDHFRAFFDYFGYTSERATGGSKLVVRSDADTLFEVELWSSEDKDSPWERLAKGKRPKQFPDVLLFPQIHLGPLSRGEGGPKLLDLTEERLSGVEDDLECRPRIFQYSFLDRYYVGWRHWCSLDASVMCVPFSINTMVLCANEDRLHEVCLPYWQARRQVRNSPFIPSSWPALIEVLRQFNAVASTDRDWQPFRMVLHDRGLYYEWLNIVLALGGVDLNEREGRLLEEITLRSPRVMAATEMFRDLAANTVQEETPRMDQQIAAFGQGRLALYVAWTDSFRFQRRAKAPGSPITTKIAEVPRLEPPHPGLKIQLAQLPRDVQYPRKSVVDGWLMGFPAGIKSQPKRMRSAFDFASVFLAPELQWKLLQGGFPSASLWAVDRELEVLGEISSANDQRPELGHRNYEVFLRALRGAITEGHWVPSPIKGPKIYEAIRLALRQILRGDSVEEKLADAEGKIRHMLRDAAAAVAAPAISGGLGHEP